MKNYFENKIIWITGGGSGIGMSLSKEFLSKGSKVVISGRRSFTNLTDLDENIIEIVGNDNIYYQICDVSDSISVVDTYKYIVNNVGIPDILINNAGIGIFKPMMDMSIDEFDKMMNTNVRGVFNTIKTVYPDMRKKGRGTIVNISSIATEEKFIGSSVYAASKSAIRMMSKILREEIRNDNIKVIDVIPGATATPIWSEKVLDKHSHKMMQPEHLAKTLVDMLESIADSSVNIEEIILKPLSGNI